MNAAQYDIIFSKCAQKIVRMTVYTGCRHIGCLSDRSRLGRELNVYYVMARTVKASFAIFFKVAYEC